MFHPIYVMVGLAFWLDVFFWYANGVSFTNAFIISLIIHAEFCLTLFAQPKWLYILAIIITFFIAIDNYYLWYIFGF